MRVINPKNENLWDEIPHLLAEHSPSGYKMACIEAEKVFKSVLKSKGYPTSDLGQTITLFGWKLTDKEGLKRALAKTKEIKEKFDYNLTSFEAEDTVESFKQGINDFSSSKALSWQRKLALVWQNYLSLKTSFAKKVLIGFLSFFLIIKLLSSTEIGHEITNFFIKIADLIFSWVTVLALIAIVMVVFIIIIFTVLEKKKTRIKSID